jgi:hypothetical protein
MLRKITLVAAPALICAVTLMANGDSAFAKGESGSHGGEKGSSKRDFKRDFHRGYDRYFRSYFGWNYPCLECAECPTCAPVAVATAPIVEVPVCTTCEPVVAGCDSCGGYWGYGREFRHRERSFNHDQKGGSGHGKK